MSALLDAADEIRRKFNLHDGTRSKVGTNNREQIFIAHTKDCDLHAAGPFDRMLAIANECPDLESYWKALHKLKFTNPPLGMTAVRLKTFHDKPLALGGGIVQEAVAIKS